MFLIKNIVLNFVDHVFFFWKYVKMIGENIFLLLVSLYFREIEEEKKTIFFCIWRNSGQSVCDLCEFSSHPLNRN